MNNRPKSDWLIDGLGAAALVIFVCAFVAFCAWAIAMWGLP